jgi:hypothetical protein
MSEEVNQEPLEQLGRILHQRLLEDDVTASAEIAETFLPLIAERLRKEYPALHDPHLVETATEDALISYFGRPQQYDPLKGNLHSYLLMSARGDLLNLLKRGKKYADQLRLVGNVELEGSDVEHGVEIQDDFDLEDWVLARNSPVWQRLRDLLPDSTDQRIVALMMEGIRETNAYADVLGILDRPADEQAAIVKRHKDRLKKKLQRGIRRTELNSNE